MDGQMILGVWTPVEHSKYWPVQSLDGFLPQAGGGAVEGRRRRRGVSNRPSSGADKLQ